MAGLLSWKGERRKGRDIKGEGESEREKKRGERRKNIERARRQRKGRKVKRE